VIWGALLVVILAGTIWGLTLLPRRRKKGEAPVIRDGGGFGEP